MAALAGPLESAAMKPIYFIVCGASSFLAVAGGAEVLGLLTQRKLFLSIGQTAFAVAFVVSCLPLIALGAFGCWRKVKRFL